MQTIKRNLFIIGLFFLLFLICQPFFKAGFNFSQNIPDKNFAQAGLVPEPNCTDECGYIGQVCTNGGVCGDYDSDSCLECSSSPSCEDECSYIGQKRCSDSRHYQVCGNYDSDACLEWASSSYCGSGKVCSNGNCINQCISHDHKACYNNDVYWYNSCNQREGKFKECGSTSSWSTWTYTCSGNKVYKTRSRTVRGCSNASCYSRQETDSQFVENCSQRSNACGYGSCSDTQRPVWSCSDGECVYTCVESSNCCAPHAYKQCYNNDVYWYDSCGNREEKANECGTSSWADNYKCSGNRLQREWINRGCSNASCFANSEWKNYQNCGSDSWTDNYRCSGNWVQRQKYKKGCANNSCYDYYQWENYQNCSNLGKVCQNGQCVLGCEDECSYIGQKRCSDSGYYQVCGDYDDDPCLEWSSSHSCGSDACIGSTWRDYYCTGWGICAYTDTNCSPNCYSCGDGTCNSECGESSTNCPEDCGWPELNITCSVNPNPAQVNQLVTFTASPSGGAGTYTYSWSGACSNNQQNCSTSFNNPGNYSATVTVTSGNQTKSASCSVIVEESQNDPVSGTLSVNPASVCVGNTINITISGQDDNGLSGFYVYYQGNWHWQSASGTSDTKTWNIVENTPGVYTYCGQVFGYEPNGTTETVNTSPYCVNVEVSNCQTPQNYLGCYNNDVWWYNPQGSLLTKYQECGDDYCNSWQERYCQDNKVYQKRTCYHRGCANGACFTSSYVETRLVEECGLNEVCSNGECKKECECFSGPCCDGCHYKSSSSVCDVKIETQYGCPWGTGCSADVGKRTRSKFRYCSGNSSACNGRWGEWSSWTSWRIADYCSINEICKPGYRKCQYSSNCTQLTPSYIKHYKKSCVGSSLWWFDSNGIRQEKYRDCIDENTCTQDSCKNGKCVFDLKCDGSTCLIGSIDYCQSCEHCGDGICNCNETNCSCPQDCKIKGLTISFLGKLENQPIEWREEIEVKPQDKVDFLITISNNGEETLKDLTVKVNLPPEIVYKNETKLEGKHLAGDLREGINLEEILPRATKTLTFKGEIASEEFIKPEKKELNVVANVTTEKLSASDSVKFVFQRKGFGITIGNITAALKDVLKRWIIWLLLILFGIVAIFLAGFYLLFWLVRKRREKQLLAKESLA
jgi:hypothetical protein